LPKKARFLAEPPTNFAFTLRFSDVQNSLRGLFTTIQVVTTSDPTADKILAFWHRNILTASLRTRKSRRQARTPPGKMADIPRSDLICLLAVHWSRIDDVLKQYRVCVLCSLARRTGACIALGVAYQPLEFVVAPARR
jgi:hypothetical protein